MGAKVTSRGRLYMHSLKNRADEELIDHANITCEMIESKDIITSVNIKTSSDLTLCELGTYFMIESNRPVECKISNK